MESDLHNSKTFIRGSEIAFHLRHQQRVLGSLAQRPGKDSVIAQSLACHAVPKPNHLTLGG